MAAGGGVTPGVGGSVGSLGALRAGGLEPRPAGAALLAVLAWAPAAGAMADLRAPCPLLRLWEQEACERLRDAFDEAFGCMPGGVAVRLMVVRARPGPALVDLAGQRDDLLVVGYGGRGWGVRSTARSPAIAWLTRAARCWPCRRPR